MTCIQTSVQARHKWRVYRPVYKQDTNDVYTGQCTNKTQMTCIQTSIQTRHKWRVYRPAYTQDLNKLSWHTNIWLVYSTLAVQTVFGFHGAVSSFLNDRIQILLLDQGRTHQMSSAVYRKIAFLVRCYFPYTPSRSLPSLIIKIYRLFIYTVYCIDCILYRLYTVKTVYCIDCILYRLHIV